MPGEQRGRFVCTVSIIALLVLSTLLVLAPASVAAQAISCGSVITRNTTLSENIGPCPGNGLIIGANNIILNCAGFTISGSASSDTFPRAGEVGIDLVGKSGVAVKNCSVSGFNSDLYLSASNANTFTGNSVEGSSADYWLQFEAFGLNKSSDNTFARNTFFDNWRAFYITSSDHNIFIGNSGTAPNVANSGFLNMFGSSHDTFVANTANSLSFGFIMYQSNDNTFIANNANGNDESFGVVSSSSNTFIGNNASDNDFCCSGVGFYIQAGSDDNTLIRNTADGNPMYGFWLTGSDNNIFTGNKANNNGINGFYLTGVSDNNILTRNTANNNGLYGYYDASSGSGTAGTANFYKSDTCTGNSGGSSPPGLCAAG